MFQTLLCRSALAAVFSSAVWVRDNLGRKITWFVLAAKDTPHKSRLVKLTLDAHLTLTHLDRRVSRAMGERRERSLCPYVCPPSSPYPVRSTTQLKISSPPDASLVLVSPHFSCTIRPKWRGNVARACRRPIFPTKIASNHGKWSISSTTTIIDLTIAILI
jgi:hypothetical protein